MEIQKKELLVYLKQFVTHQRQEKIKTLLKIRTRHIAVVLEDLYQSANISAIMRTCDALGVQDVHCVELRNQIAINKGISLGAAKWLTIDRYQQQPNETNNPTLECVLALKKQGYTIVATSPHATMPVSQLSLDKKVAFLFGTEDQGLTEEAINAADQIVEIPMYGFVESFNVSVSAALCLYDATLRLRASAIDWHLSEQAQEELELDWIRASLDHADVLERTFFEEFSHKK